MRLRGPLFHLSDGFQIWMIESVPGLHRDCGLVGITPVIRRGYPCRAENCEATRSGFQMEWKKIRSWWPYALLGLTALGVVYRWLRL
jgi:hypothetical protein